MANVMLLAVACAVVASSVILPQTEGKKNLKKARQQIQLSPKDIERITARREPVSNVTPVIKALNPLKRSLANEKSTASTKEWTKVSNLKRISDHYKELVPQDKDNVKKIVQPHKLRLSGAVHYVTGVERKDGSGCVVMFVRKSGKVEAERGPECRKNQNYDLIQKWKNLPVPSKL